MHFIINSSNPIETHHRYKVELFKLLFMIFHRIAAVQGEIHILCDVDLAVRPDPRPNLQSGGEK